MYAVDFRHIHRLEAYATVTSRLNQKPKAAGKFRAKIARGLTANGSAFRDCEKQFAIHCDVTGFG